MARWSELWKLLRNIRREAEKHPAPSSSLPSTNDDPEQEIELLGRDASYHDRDFQNVIDNEIRVVKSSNVYSYYFEPENSASGILFVTFLFWEPGVKADERDGPGLTYAYYDFPNAKFQAFNSEAASSAGKAVWDFCRERGSVHGHQHRYRLIQSSGDYVPRKATANGFAERTLVSPGLSPTARRQTFRRSESRTSHPAGQFFKRNTLDRTPGAGRILRGTPNRGNPNRGEPNRGN